MLWSLHPFPSIVKVPEFPHVALDDVWRTREKLDDTFGGNGDNFVRPQMLANGEVGNVDASRRQTETLHCTAVGKVLLANAPPAQVDGLLGEGPLERLTKRTITSVAQLRRELATVRMQGYALDREECEEGGHCIAVPVRSPVRDLGLVDALQSLETWKKSAVIRCENGAQLARIWVCEGEVIDAELAPLSGEAADIVFGRTNSKQENGAVGLLTGDALERSLVPR